MLEILKPEVIKMYFRMPYGNWSWLFIILFFAAMFFLRRCGWGRGCGVPYLPRRPNYHYDYRKSEAIEILNKRYANGEIDDEEYRRKKEEILR